MGGKREVVRKWEGAEEVVPAGWRRLQKWKRERRAQKAILAWVQPNLLFTFKGDNHHASVNSRSLLLMKNWC